MRCKQTLNTASPRWLLCQFGFSSDLLDLTKTNCFITTPKKKELKLFIKVIVVVDVLTSFYQYSAMVLFANILLPIILIFFIISPCCCFFFRVFLGFLLLVVVVYSCCGLLLLVFLLPSLPLPPSSSSSSCG